MIFDPQTKADWEDFRANTNPKHQPMIDPNHPIHPTVAGANRTGLTTREHFAARALQGILSREGENAIDRAGPVSAAAVAFADALVDTLNIGEEKRQYDAAEDVPREWSESKLSDEREAFEEWAMHARETRFIDYNQAWLGWIAAKASERPVVHTAQP